MANDTVAVLGPGGVGGLLGGLLARAGHRVVFLARPATAAALRETGLTVTSTAFGDFTVPVEADTQLREPVAACLITVKATALGDALTRLPADASGAGLLVPFLNGVDHMSLLRERYPTASAVAGTIVVESTRVAPGRIEHASPFARIELASVTVERQRLDQLAGLFAEVGLDASVRADETAILWNKASFLAPMALLTTHARAPIGVVRNDRRSTMLAVIDEISEVAQASGGTVDAETVVVGLDRMPETLKSSMLRDAEAGRAIELDAIGGAVLRAAERHGIDVSVTAGLVDDLRVPRP
ncbi:2-dehydropantoate 2-reductase [Actinopolymorpha sp. B9G3]|uniref:ketopantoate reductase family protein n=1 Tax=Actinopolymorpha sp. B9G3 TaxID=3158970 RepID=UPI0032D97F32